MNNSARFRYIDVGRGEMGMEKADRGDAIVEAPGPWAPGIE
jgi:hypothetical protein